MAKKGSALIIFISIKLVKITNGQEKDKPKPIRVSQYCPVNKAEHVQENPRGVKLSRQTAPFLQGLVSQIDDPAVKVN